MVNLGNIIGTVLLMACPYSSTVKDSTPSEISREFPKSGFSMNIPEPLLMWPIANSKYFFVPFKRNLDEPNVTLTWPIDKYRERFDRFDSSPPIPKLRSDKYKTKIYELPYTHTFDSLKNSATPEVRR